MKYCDEAVEYGLAKARSIRFHFLSNMIFFLLKNLYLQEKNDFLYNLEYTYSRTFVSPSDLVADQEHFGYPRYRYFSDLNRKPVL